MFLERDELDDLDEELGGQLDEGGLVPALLPLLPLPGPGLRDPQTGRLPLALPLPGTVRSGVRTHPNIILFSDSLHDGMK